MNPDYCRYETYKDDGAGKSYLWLTGQCYSAINPADRKKNGLIGAPCKEITGDTHGEGTCELYGKCKVTKTTIKKDSENITDEKKGKTEADKVQQALQAESDKLKTPTPQSGPLGGNLFKSFDEPSTLSDEARSEEAEILNQTNPIQRLPMNYKFNEPPYNLGPQTRTPGQQNFTGPQNSNYQNPSNTFRNSGGGSSSNTNAIGPQYQPLFGPSRTVYSGPSYTSILNRFGYY